MNSSTSEKPLLQADFPDYVSTFVQKHPRYAIKLPGRRWRSKRKPLADPAIQAHLEGKYSVASLGQWYPHYGTLDFDGTPLDRVEEVRSLLGFNDRNSQIDTSESQDSYHLHFIPEYKGKPPTLQLLQSCLKDMGLRYNFEIYPQKNKPFRLPFGTRQRTVSWPHANLPQDWPTRLYWFHKLNSFSLEELPRVNRRLPLEVPQKQLTELSYTVQGREYWEQGLVGPHSRHDAQFCVIVWCYRQNIPLEETIRLVWKWVQKKHNGFSPTVLRSPRAVYQEIVRQARSWYGKAAAFQTFPDTTHLNHLGYLCKADLLDIIRVCRGSLPKMKFTGALVRYLNPRRYRDRIGIHRDKLISWSSHHMYIKRLEELEGVGLLNRSDSYSVGSYSKEIKLNWTWRSTSDAILEDNRSTGHPTGDLPRAVQGGIKEGRDC